MGHLLKKEERHGVYLIGGHKKILMFYPSALAAGGLHFIPGKGDCP